MRRIAIALAAVCACAHGEKAGAPAGLVSDVDFGQLQPQQLGPVDEARTNLRRAEYELARAKTRSQEASHEDDLARADQKAADAQIDRANAQLKAAQDRGDQAAVTEAQNAVEAAQVLKQAADAHIDYATKIAAARKTKIDAAQRRVDLEQSQVELAKLHALEQARDPAATKYDPAVFARNVADAQIALDQASKGAQDDMSKAQAARQNWHSLVNRYQAMASQRAQPG